MAGRDPPYNAAMTSTGLLVTAAPASKPTLAAELTDRAAEAGLAGYARTAARQWPCGIPGENATALSTALPFDGLVFARQKLELIADLRGLDPKDRITPILDALGVAKNKTAGQGPPYGDLFVEHPDSDAGKPLSGLARSFGNALRPALRKQGLLAAKENRRLPRLHVCFVAGDHALVARARPGDSAPWPLGIPRLKLHADAPSRSALKLEEALLTLVDDTTPRAAIAGRQDRRRPRRRARLDVGAGTPWPAGDRDRQRPPAPARARTRAGHAPARRRFPVATATAAGLDGLRHGRAAFAVARRMGDWFREGWCRQAIFNLKLPMKKRWQETRLCLDLFRDSAGIPLEVHAKQLYHDREEITVFAVPPPRR